MKEKRVTRVEERAADKEQAKPAERGEEKPAVDEAKLLLNRAAVEAARKRVEYEHAHKLRRNRRSRNADESKQQDRKKQEGGWHEKVDREWKDIKRSHKKTIGRKVVS